jgi:predicted unusual protein kinase regulating ubiquinone biosynthesis (AarF/ABC1/UbiB family)
MERNPVAAASIGQDDKATLTGERAVAVKAQYRGIEQALARCCWEKSHRLTLPT